MKWVLHCFCVGSNSAPAITGQVGFTFLKDVLTYRPVTAYRYKTTRKKMDELVISRDLTEMKLGQYFSGHDGARTSQTVAAAAAAAGDVPVDGDEPFGGCCHGDVAGAAAGGRKAAYGFRHCHRCGRW